MNEIENDFNKIYSPNLTFYDFRTKKFTLKTENALLLMAPPQFVLQDIKKSFEGAHWDTKNY